MSWRVFRLDSLPRSLDWEEHGKRQRAAASQDAQRRTRTVVALRQALASYWTSGFALAAMSWLHWRWLWRSAHAGDVLSAYGAGLVVLGVWVAARPYLRSGLGPVIEAGMPQNRGAFATGHAYHESLRRARDEALPRVTRDVWAERVVAVAVVMAGTLLNGWGTPLARRWGLPV